MSGDAQTVIDIILIDDEDISRSGFSAVLNSESDMQVVAETSSASDALPLIGDYFPQVILTTSRVSGMENIEFIRRLWLLSETYTPGVIILTGEEGDISLLPTLRAGVRGFLVKRLTPFELTHAVRAVAGGQAVICPTIAKMLTERLLSLPAVPGQTRPESWTRLSERELDVLRLVASGNSNREIAGRLYLSEATIKSHLSNLMDKLELRNRVEVALFFYQVGLSCSLVNHRTVRS